jgi:tRNA (guanine37-N1)-methyltransferase
VRLDFITIFPDYFQPLELSLPGKARRRGTLQVSVHDLRQWTDDVHRTVDDSPYGGGPGMVMTPEPWGRALASITGRDPGGREPVSTGPDAAGQQVGPRIVMPTPAGRRFDQAYAAELATAPWLIFCCGRYEGIDARVADAWADDEISIGDYVLNGGEVAALVIVEAVVRLLPGVLGNAESAGDDSFVNGLLEAPAYTRPPVWEGREVPEVLRSGDHGAIARWRREQSLARTRAVRPDLLPGDLTGPPSDGCGTVESRE